MLRKLIATDDDAAITVLRLVTGIVFFAHGAQKMLGWFGGYGFTGTMGFFTVGLFSRVAAFGILCNMLVAVAMVHHQFGFFMNWAARKREKVLSSTSWHSRLRSS